MHSQEVAHSKPEEQKRTRPRRLPPLQAGEVHGRLTILRVFKIRTAGNYLRSFCECVCSCGNATTNAVTAVRSGHTRSCGCLHLENVKRVNRKHGACSGSYRDHTPEYYIWSAMKRRCSNKSDRMYFRYGGRGIKVCDRWLRSFENFIADMGARPSKSHSLDRINNDVGYSPENCRWATAVEQARNKSQVKLIEAFGQKMIMKDWADKFQMCYKVLHYRLKSGMRPEDALMRIARVVNSPQP